MPIQNFHTHTWRCNHATDTEREYIEQAIAAGMQTLGFADHAPYPFVDGHFSGARMRVDQTAEYFETLLALKEEYADRIRILIGFEAEYYPDSWPAFLENIHQFPCDYLIMGQHCLGDEDPNRYVSTPTDDPATMEAYIDQVLTGLRTGKFSYLAHPDMFRWAGDSALYHERMTYFCEEIKKLGLPLEINLLGQYETRHYPREEFWKIVGEVGNRAILGCDAHMPEAINRPEVEAAALALAARYHIPVSQELELHRP